MFEYKNQSAVSLDWDEREKNSVDEVQATWQLMWAKLLQEKVTDVIFLNAGPNMLTYCLVSDFKAKVTDVQ